MAKKNDLPHVVLLTPDGDEHRATNTGELNNLVFGAGYKLKDSKLTVDEALAQLAEALDEDGHLPVPAAAEAATSTSASAPASGPVKSN